MKSFCKNEQGSVIVHVLIVTVVLTLLGTVLISVTLTGAQHTKRQEKNTMAYYLARSGADAAASHLLANPEELSAIISYGEDEVELEDGKFVVDVTEAGGQVIIRSTGFADGYSETVTLTLIPGGGPIFDMAVFSLTSIELEGSAYIERSGTNSTEPGGINFDWDTNVYGDLYIGPGGGLP